MVDPDYPAYICADCGQSHGRRPVGIATWHMGICDLCGRPEMVTEPRDFGHLKDSWKGVKPHA
jgi:hypothetical protein